ncbi:uncharacterized protein MONBRDRAFT_22031 [Monosiga brevicollis MX1]|uniref:N-acetylgalactosaminide beta-1,3-galactosyltransferase n=1 Tax=Monosiga brevicollis TaxID=81824 RepID=A9UPC2_MONBE|nr:uncharacterized protein MONBRDRAFT_22031 [Monosiga brevicollis MX1]EDQ92391.1 predicted protein [Monosiga brevicollis MX1]|eukprot:XP_001742153.1 hypothetical protein [Monosiga brevicollis MX1]
MARGDHDDDDPAIQAIADELMQEGYKANPPTARQPSAHLPQAQASHHQHPQHVDPIVHVIKRESSNNNRAQAVSNALDQLNLHDMLEAPVEHANGQAVHDAAIRHPPATQPKDIPDYLLNTMKDEPPYGTPPDETAKKDPSIYCFVLTTPKRHDPKAIAVNNSWGLRMDRLDFMTSEPYPGLNTVLLRLRNESRKTLWPKIKLAWLHTYQHHLDDHDWFMKADDDTFVVVDNLRQFLAQYDPNKPHFFGHRFLLHRGQGPQAELSYYSGGAGYVLSRAALKLLGDNAAKALTNNGLAEDVEMARSMLKVGVTCEDSRDAEGHERFLPMNIDNMRYRYKFATKPKFWYWRYVYFPPKDGLQRCSNDQSASYTHTHSLSLSLSLSPCLSLFNRVS